MTRQLAARTRQLKPSPTLGITARAKAMCAEGRDVISLSVGEPDFNTPEPICEAAIKALRDGHTKYGPSAGYPFLREAIARKLVKRNGIAAESNQVVVSCGAKHSVYNTLQVTVDAGDEVILLAPYWMTYADQIRLAGAEPVVIMSEARDHFNPDPEAIEAAVTPRTRAIIVNSPSNPTGCIYTRETLAHIARIAAKHNLWVISDEIYEDLIYEGEHVSLASAYPEIAAQTITVSGFSKTYSMTGWRIGYCHAPVELAKAMQNLQDQVTSNPTSFAQYGAAAALDYPQEKVAEMRETFRTRRDLFLRRLAEIEGVETPQPHGAFYVFPDMTAHIREGETCHDLAEFLLEKTEIATVPGGVFDGPGHLRLSYAVSQEQINQAVDRMAEALACR